MLIQSKISVNKQNITFGDMNVKYDAKNATKEKDYIHEQSHWHMQILRHEKKTTHHTRLKKNNCCICFVIDDINKKIKKPLIPRKILKMATLIATELRHYIQQHKARILERYSSLIGT